MITRALVSLSVCALSLCAQTAETAIFRAVLLPSSEVPPVNSTNRAVADIFASIVRDGTGQIVSGTVDFVVRPAFAAAATCTGIELRSGAAGQNGNMALSTGIGTANSRAIASGSDLLQIPVQVDATDTASLAALRALFQDPSQLYLNLLTTTNPAGAVRGQLQRAEAVVLMGLLNSANVVPFSTAGASGAAQVVAVATRDAKGAFTSGAIYMAASVYSDDTTVFNGFHIHVGQPGAAGAIGLSATLPAGMQVDPDGTADIGPIYSEVTVSNATQLGAFAGLMGNPGGLYIDLHTTANANGVMRAQLRRTDTMTFPLVLDSANEVVKPRVAANAPAALTVSTLRNEDGSVAAATILSDIDYRFPGPTQFLGAFLHDAPAKVDGPVSVLLATNFASDTGFGHYFNWTLPLRDLAPVEDLIKNPENHYVNLHTFTDPAGAARAQLGQRISSVPVVAAVLPANLDKSATAIAPGSLVAIFGTNLVKVATDLTGWTGQTIPSSLNGTHVTIGGKPAPLLYVGPGQINAQVPIDLASGNQQVVVDNGNGPSAGIGISVAPVAPAIFYYPVAAILKSTNFSLVSTANPTKAGEILVVYCTGLGRTTPAIATGLLAPVSPLSNTAPVTATIGGKSATVIYSIASPQFVGLYQVAVTVPAGVSGTVPLALQQGGVNSNAVTIPVQ
jgi:uncharacterized protein (TIGR03437 family)